MRTPQQYLLERLKPALDESGLKRSTIAERSGYSMDYIRAIANGHQMNPSVTFVWAVARVIGVSPSWLLGWESKDED